MLHLHEVANFIFVPWSMQIEWIMSNFIAIALIAVLTLRWCRIACKKPRHAFTIDLFVKFINLHQASVCKTIPWCIL